MQSRIRSGVTGLGVRLRLCSPMTAFSPSAAQSETYHGSFSDIPTRMVDINPPRSSAQAWRTAKTLWSDVCTLPCTTLDCP